MCAVIYRPPDTGIINFITDYLERNINDCSTTVLLDNFNIHVNKEDDHNTITFNYFLDSFGLINQVSFPTHRLDNTLDLILTHETSNTITEVKQGRLVSDHHQVLLNITDEQSTTGKKVCSYRKLKKIDTNQFKKDIKSALSNTDLESLDASSSSILHSNMLRKILNQHAPLKSLIIPKYPGIVKT